MSSGDNDPYTIYSNWEGIGKFQIDLQAKTVTTECSVYRGVYFQARSNPGEQPVDPDLDLTRVEWNHGQRPIIWHRGEVQDDPGSFGYFTRIRYGGERNVLYFRRVEHMTRSTHTFDRGVEAGKLTIQLGKVQGGQSGFSGFIVTSERRVKQVLRFFHRYANGKRCEVPVEDLINDDVSWEKCTWSTRLNDAVTLQMTLQLYKPTAPHMIVHAFVVPFWTKRALRIMMRRWRWWKDWQSILLSLACSRHPRLGEGSMIQELSDELLRMITALSL